jgi:hypothetical protein
VRGRKRQRKKRRSSMRRRLLAMGYDSVLFERWAGMPRGMEVAVGFGVPRFAAAIPRATARLHDVLPEGSNWRPFA